MAVRTTTLHKMSASWPRILSTHSILPARRSFTDQLASASLWIFVFTIPMENVLVLPGVGTVSRLSGLIALPLCLFAVLERGWLRSLSPIHGVMAAFVLWCSLTYFWSREPGLTLAAIGTYLQLLMMVWLFWELARTEEQQIRLLKAFVWGATASSLATLSSDVALPTQFYERYVAFGFDPNDLGLILALSVPLSLYLAEVEKRTIPRLLHRVQTAVAVAAIFMTASRGAAFALFAGLILLPLNFWHGSIRERKEICVLLLLAVGLSLLFVPRSSWTRLGSAASEVREGDFNQRVLIWQTGWDYFREQPFLGLGVSAFAPTIERRLGQPSSGAFVAHNSFLSILFETGTVGFSLYAGLLLAVVVAAASMARLDRNLWFAAFLAWGVGVSSLTWEYRKPTWFLFGLLAAQAGRTTLRGRSHWFVSQHKPAPLKWHARVFSQ